MVFLELGLGAPVLKLEPEPRAVRADREHEPIVMTTITPSTTHCAQFSIVATPTTQSAMPTIRAITL